MTDRRPLTHEEWVARAERDVRTRCYPWERVPGGPEHYLTADEVAELRRLENAISKATRTVLTREIRRLRAALPEKPRKAADVLRWYDALSAVEQEQYQHLVFLEDARAGLARIINGRPVDTRRAINRVADLVPDKDTFARWRDLDAKYARLHEQAAQRATDEAVAKEIARRRTDEAWARELERRARPAVLIVDL